MVLKKDDLNAMNGACKQWGCFKDNSDKKRTLILWIRKWVLKFLLYIMNKEGLENLTPTVHMEGKKRITVSNMPNELVQRIVKRQTLVRKWCAMITHVLKEQRKISIQFELLLVNVMITTCINCQQLENLNIALKKNSLSLSNCNDVMFCHNNTWPHTAKNMS